MNEALLNRPEASMWNISVGAKRILFGFLIYYTNHLASRTDRQTDRQPDNFRWQYRAHFALRASRGKENDATTQTQLNTTQKTALANCNHLSYERYS